MANINPIAYAVQAPESEIPKMNVGGTPLATDSVKTAPATKGDGLPNMEATIYDTPEFDDYVDAHQKMVDYFAETGLNPNAPPSNRELLDAWKQGQRYIQNFYSKGIQLKEIADATKQQYKEIAQGNIIGGSPTTTYAGLQQGYAVHPVDNAIKEWNDQPHKYNTQAELDAANVNRSALIEAMTAEAQNAVNNGVDATTVQNYFARALANLKTPILEPVKPKHDALDYAKFRETQELNDAKIANMGKKGSGNFDIDKDKEIWFNDLMKKKQGAIDYVVGGEYQGLPIIEAGINDKGVAFVRMGEYKLNPNDNTLQMVATKKTAENYKELTPELLSGLYLSSQKKKGVPYSKTDEAIGADEGGNAKTLTAQTLKSKVGTKGFEGYTYEELKDYYISQGYKVIE